MNTLDQVLDNALQLPLEQQEMLIRILQSRQNELRRTEIAEDAKKSLDDFRSGTLRPQSADEVISSLRQSLQNLDE
jgi:hypothetical protein